MTKRLHKPREPAPGECCGSGCARCVWDVYYDKLAAYEAEKTKLNQEEEELLEEEYECKRESLDEYSESDSFDSDWSDRERSTSSVDDEAVCDYTGSVVIKFVDAPPGKTEAMVEEEIRQSDLLKEFIAVRSFTLKQDNSACINKSTSSTAPTDCHHHHENTETVQDVALSFITNRHPLLDNYEKRLSSSVLTKENKENSSCREDGDTEESCRTNNNEGGIFVTELELFSLNNVYTPTLMPGDVIEVFVPNHMPSSALYENMNNTTIHEHVHCDNKACEDVMWDNIYELCTLMQVSPTAWCELRRSPFVPESHFPPWLPERFAMTVRLLLAYFVDVSSGGYLLRPNFIQNLWRVYELQRQAHCKTHSNKTSASHSPSSCHLECSDQNKVTQDVNTHLCNKSSECLMEEESLSELEENATPFLLGALATCTQPAELSRLLNNTHHPLCYPQLVDILRVFKFVYLPLARLCELSGPIRPRKFSVVNEKMVDTSSLHEISTINNCIDKIISKSNSIKTESSFVVELCIRETCSTIPSLPEIKTFWEIEHQQRPKEEEEEVHKNNINMTTIEKINTKKRDNYKNNNKKNSSSSTMPVESLAYTLARLLNNAALVRSRKREHVKWKMYKEEYERIRHTPECTNLMRNFRRDRKSTVDGGGRSNNNDEIKENVQECLLRTGTSTPNIFRGHVSHPLCRLSIPNTRLSQDLFHDSHNTITTEQMEKVQSSVPSLSSSLHQQESSNNLSTSFLLPRVYVSRRLYNTSTFAQQLYKAVHGLISCPSHSVQTFPKLLLIGAGTGIAPMMAAVNMLWHWQQQQHTYSVHSFVQQNKFEQNLCEDNEHFHDSRRLNISNSNETISTNTMSKRKENNCYAQTHTSREHPYPCWVFYGARTREELVYHDTLINALNAGVIAKYEWVTSRTNVESYYNHYNNSKSTNNISNDNNVDSNTAVQESSLRYVTELMTKYAEVIRTSLLEKDGQVFICGPSSMLRSCRELLLHSSILAEANETESNEDDESVADQRLRFLEARHQINFDVWSSVNIFE